MSFAATAWGLSPGHVRDGRGQWIVAGPMSIAATAWGLSPGHVPRGRGVRCRRVSLDAWILALHLLAAFAFVAAVAGYWGMIAAGWNARLPREVLAISLDAYQPWDGWVIAAIVLWLVAGAAGGRAGPEYERARSRAEELAAEGPDAASDELTALIRTRQGLVMHSVTTLAALLLLIDMIWKPGA